MLRFHRTTYVILGENDGPAVSTWWQLGSRIFRHRLTMI